MEVFGTAASAISVAALFSNCVDCFEYIQLGRQFGQDFERCQIKLDIARTRLGRWGQAIGITSDAQFARGGELSQQVQDVLEEIMLLFQAVQKSSKRYELKATQGDLVCFTNADMRPEMRRVHGHLREISQQRQQKTSLFKKVRWAVYDGKNLDKLVGEITDLVGALETLVPPVEAVQRQLSAMELEDVENESTLLTIRDVAFDTDTILSEAADRKIANISARNHVTQILGDESSNVWVGDEWNTKLRGFTERTENTVGSIAAKGQATVRIGNNYNGRG